MPLTEDSVVQQAAADPLAAEHAPDVGQPILAARGDRRLRRAPPTAAPDDHRRKLIRIRAEARKGFELLKVIHLQDRTGHGRTLMLFDEMPVFGEDVEILIDLRQSGAPLIDHAAFATGIPASEIAGHWNASS